MKNKSWIDSLDSVLGQEPVSEKVPEGWFTIKQAAKHRGLSESRANFAIKKLYESGALERKIFKIPVGTRLYPTPHYRFK